MTTELGKEIIANYERHGWHLRRVLLRPESLLELAGQSLESFNQVKLIEAEFDALWFSRPSHGGREAWELRHVAEQPYALFEAFEAEEIEEDREERRTEMEALMREHVAPQFE